jgi:hypothetical protein
VSEWVSDELLASNILDILTINFAQIMTFLCAKM